ncbi:MAG: hypothetical protein NWS77_06445, partial [Burkholderiaceae bacterium]|nr:hypothetical protein [Burkholderiaceae bacterium]
MKDILKVSLAGLMVPFVMVPLTLIALIGLAGPAAQIEHTASDGAERRRLQFRGVTAQLVAAVAVLAAMIGGW